MEGERRVVLSKDGLDLGKHFTEHDGHMDVQPINSLAQG